VQNFRLVLAVEKADNSHQVAMVGYFQFVAEEYMNLLVEMLVRLEVVDNRYVVGYWEIYQPGLVTLLVGQQPLVEQSLVEQSLVEQASSTSTRSSWPLALVLSAVL